MEGVPYSIEATDPKNICVIGAGPSGLGALKVILDSTQYKAGIWRPLAFEAREDIGGVWLPAPPVDDPPVTPIYDSLTTNVPHPAMAYGSLPFPSGTPLYPSASTVLTYLHDYASKFNLGQFIRLNTTAQKADWESDKQKWKIVTTPSNYKDDTLAQEAREHWFDFVIVANGHHRVPNYPDTPGIRAWVETGKASHSAWYRRAHHMGNVILVVGGGPSGMDVASEMLQVSKVVIHSVPGTTHADINDGTFKQRGRIVEFMKPEQGRVLFADGTSETGIDHCILATGYEHSIPFLPEHILRCSTPLSIPSIPPLPSTLYNSKHHIFPLAKHLFPLTTAFPPSSIAFLALPLRVAPFPIVEAQVRAVLKVFAEPQSLDLAQEVLNIVSRYEDLRRRIGGDEHALARAWHLLGAGQFDYQDELHQFAGGEYAKDEWRSPQWVREIHEYKDILRAEWNKLVNAGEAEKWVESVSATPGEEETKQWVDLMWRVLARAGGMKHHE